jgi:alpha-N-acetylglucosaminidase
MPITFRETCRSTFFQFASLFILLILPADFAQAVDPATTAATDVLKRLLGEKFQSVTLEFIPPAQELDVYEFESQQGRPIVRGSSSVALCRGFYDYLRTNNLGMVGWTDTRLEIPKHWPDAARTRVASPFRFRHLYNAVTFGYYSPYWTWDRWEKELDWMALHGYNMALMPVATEAIAQRVWQKLGLTQQEIDENSTGPAYLPFLRMGCIVNHGGPLPQSWHRDQLALQHKIISRMRELGIEPVYQGFAGFVPKGLKRLHPEITLHQASWGGFPAEKQSLILMPDAPLFPEISKVFIDEWEREFGKGKYYLVDSFNEMALPETGRPVTELLADYGEAIHKSIQAANPDAVWVIQGWMFGFQRNIWNKDTVKALLSKVPDGKMLILDYANDYNGTFWRNGTNWELFDGFGNQPWVYGVVPNMGGKVPYNGFLSFYATDSVRALNSPKKGRLVGFTVSAEATENNEPIYELLSEMAWRTEAIDLDQWTKGYCLNRFGKYPEAMKTAWALLRQSCYGSFTDHPRFGWQDGNCEPGTVNREPRYFQAVEAYLACAGELGQSPLYRHDALELAATYLCLKAEDWFQLAKKAHEAGQAKLRDQAADRALELLAEADRLLESHPIYRLARWLDFARSHGENEVQRRFYESDARRIVTVWGPPINDYSCRMWSGLIRDFYRERMSRYFEGLKTGKAFDRAAWEEQWVRGSGISKIEPFADPLAAAVSLVKTASEETLPKLPGTAGETVNTDKAE